MPGTGKTATTMEVIRNLKEKYKFSFLSINAMQLSNPNLVYTIIYEKITGHKVAPASAALFLDEFFKVRYVRLERIGEDFGAFSKTWTEKCSSADKNICRLPIEGWIGTARDKYI